MEFPAIFYKVCILIIFGRLNANVTKQKLVSFIFRFQLLIYVLIWPLSYFTALAETIKYIFVIILYRLFMFGF